MTAVLTEASSVYDATKTGGDNGKRRAVGAEVMRVRSGCSSRRRTRRGRLNFIRTEFCARFKATDALNYACAARRSGSDDSGWFLPQPHRGMMRLRFSALADEVIAFFSRNVIEAVPLLPRHFRQPPGPQFVPLRSFRVSA